MSVRLGHGIVQSCLPRGKLSSSGVSWGTRGVLRVSGFGLQGLMGLCCFIAETDNSCKVCCRDEQDRCTPYVDANNQFLFLRKGKPCTVGFCDSNVSVLGCQCTAQPAFVAVTQAVLIERRQSSVTPRPGCREAHEGSGSPPILGHLVLWVCWQRRHSCLQLPGAGSKPVQVESGSQKITIWTHLLPHGVNVRRYLRLQIEFSSINGCAG